MTGLSMAECEKAALRAYRTGTFFGSVAALATNSDDQVVLPFDRSEFRFTKIKLRRDGNGQPIAVAVNVAGNNPDQRPNIQIRFVTDQGIVSVADTLESEFLLPLDDSGRPSPKYVRIEAFAYPSTHNKGEKFTKEAFQALNVHDISLLHDRRAKDGPTYFGKDQKFPARIPLVDMIFSQPLRFL
jgi:hypothetical protein